MVEKTPQDAVALTWQMTISREEFLRCLPAAVDFVPFQVVGNSIENGDTGRGWQMELVALPDQCIGALKLQRHSVKFRFVGYSSEEVSAFMSRVEVYFRRGGG